MPRTLRVYWPSVRNTPGSSFGPITISATTPMSRNSVQLMSNMETPRPPCRAPKAQFARGRRDSALNLALGTGALLHIGGRLVIDGLDRCVSLGRRIRRILIGHALL